MEELYDDFHVIKLPLQLSEVRGVDALRSFSRLLLEPADIPPPTTAFQKDLGTTAITLFQTLGCVPSIRFGKQFTLSGLISTSIISVFIVLYLYISL